MSQPIDFVMRKRVIEQEDAVRRESVDEFRAAMKELPEGTFMKLWDAFQSGDPRQMEAVKNETAAIAQAVHRAKEEALGSTVIEHVVTEFNEAYQAGDQEAMAWALERFRITLGQLEAYAKLASMRGAPLGPWIESFEAYQADMTADATYSQVDLFAMTAMATTAALWVPGLRYYGLAPHWQADCPLCKAQLQLQVLPWHELAQQGGWCCGSCKAGGGDLASLDLAIRATKSKL